MRAGFPPASGEPLGLLVGRRQGTLEGLGCAQMSAGMQGKRPHSLCCHGTAALATRLCSLSFCSFAFSRISYKRRHTYVARVWLIHSA